VEFIGLSGARDVLGSGEAITDPRRDKRHVGFALDNRNPSGHPKSTF
jgi:hypothetical protein